MLDCSDSCLQGGPECTKPTARRTMMRDHTSLSISKLHTHTPLGPGCMASGKLHHTSTVRICPLGFQQPEIWSSATRTAVTSPALKAQQDASPLSHLMLPFQQLQWVPKARGTEFQLPGWSPVRLCTHWSPW